MFFNSVLLLKGCCIFLSTSHVLFPRFVCFTTKRSFLCIFVRLCASVHAGDDLVRSGRHVVIVGDFNVTHKDIDVHSRWRVGEIYTPGVCPSFFSLSMFFENAAVIFYRDYPSSFELVNELHLMHGYKIITYSNLIYGLNASVSS